MDTLHLGIKHIPHLAVSLTRCYNDIMIATNIVCNIRDNCLGTAQLTQGYDLQYTHFSSVLGRTKPKNILYTQIYDKKQFCSKIYSYFSATKAKLYFFDDDSKS